MNTKNIKHLKLAVLNNNREIHVNNDFINSIRAKGVLIPLILIEAKELDDDIELRDLMTNEVIKDKSDYHVILDGQHRAFALLTIIKNEDNKVMKNAEKIKKWEKREKKNKNTEPKPTEYKPQYIPSIKYEVVTIKEISDINDYIITINSKSRKWDNTDYIRHAYITRKDDDKIKAIFELNSRKIPRTTISYICCGDKDSIKVSTLTEFANTGENLHYVNVRRGIPLYIYLFEKGFANDYLRKRHLWEFIAKEERVSNNINIVLHRIECLTEEDINKICALKGSDLVSDIRKIVYDASTMVEEDIKKGNIPNHLSSISEDKIQQFLNGKYPKTNKAVLNSNADVESNIDSKGEVSDDSKPKTVSSNEYDEVAAKITFTNNAAEVANATNQGETSSYD